MDIFNDLKKYLSDRGEDKAVGLIDEFIRDRVAGPTEAQLVEFAINAAADVWNIPVVAIPSRSRKQEYVGARQFVCKFLYDNTRMSTPKIGMVLGGRDHSSILHGMAKTTDHIEVEPPYRKMWGQFLDKMGVDFYIHKPKRSIINDM